jgi:uncharacterized protein DUF6338
VEFPTPEQLSHLLAMLANGFVARWAYGTQRSMAKEEHGATLMWALVWSGILVPLYAASPFTWASFTRLGKDGALALNFCCNLLFSVTLGLIVGRISLVRKLHRAKRPPNREKWLKFFWGAFFDQRTRDFQSVTDHHMNTDADGRWVIVEMAGEKAYEGWIKSNDARSSAEYTIQLAEARLVEAKTGRYIEVRVWPHILLNHSEIREIKTCEPVKPPVAEPKQLAGND